MENSYENQSFSQSDLASFPSRLGAITIDTLIGLPLGLIVVWPIISEYSNERTLGMFLIMPVFILRSFFQIKDQQSIGQKILKIKILNLGYDQVTSGLLRNLLLFFMNVLPGLNIINALLVIFSKSKQGLHDKLAKTYVVKVNQAAK